MKSNKEIFQENFNSGGYIEPHQSVVGLKEKLNQVAKDFSGPEIDIYVDFIDDTTVNAFATKIENTYFIGINIGVLSLYDFFAQKISANPNLLVEFGESAGESDTELIDLKSINDSNVLENVLKPKPTTKSRTILANWIFQQSILNIFFHELGHILNGHVDLLLSGGVGFIQEYSSVKSKMSAMASLDRQTMEIDADAYSARSTFNTLMEEYNTNYQGCRDILKNENYVFRLWAFVRMLSWRILENNFIGENLLSITHPPTSLRYVFSRVSIVSLLSYRNMDVDQFHIAYMSGSNEADHALKTILTNNFISDTLPGNIGILHNTHGAIIFCHWDDLREKLLQKTHIPLRDPNVFFDTEADREFQNQYKLLRERI
ncbi:MULTISPECIES: M48 family metalloprotease [Sphingobacterium]|uniref:M48 family metalloprotease n=1 Tax=Sphingobacterium TaxID=28453 RepID=UPI00257DC242|nr:MULTISPECIES: M48 family metalloprotease [Sphingobacterium]